MDLEEENKLLREMIERARQYNKTGGRACPLCVYENGKFIKPCSMHLLIETLTKIIDLLRERACHCDVMNGYTCDIHEKERQIYQEYWEIHKKLYPDNK